MYNLKEAHKEFIQSAAYLARDMVFDPDNPPSENRVDNWRESTMKLIQQHKAAHKEIERIREENQRLERLETERVLV